MKPILFNTDMVRAILDGRKTVTRRVVKPPYYIDEKVILPKSGLCMHRGTNETGGMPYADALYHPGDILYVRETWCRQHSEEYPFVYRASVLSPDAWKGQWCPSIHMPREAARIFLRVTNVRVERLHQITNDEVQAEGVKRRNIRPGGCSCAWKTETCMNEPCGNRDGYEAMCWYIPFSEVWDSTIRPGDRVRYGWLGNPWVWVIKFERIRKEGAGI